MKMRAALIASAMLTAMPAEAATYIITYTGNARIVADQYNYLGGLTGSHAYTATYTVDDTLGTIDTTGSTASFVRGGATYGLSVPMSGVLTIGGVSITLGTASAWSAVFAKYTDYANGFDPEYDFIANVIDEILTYDPDTGLSEQFTLRNSLFSDTNEMFGSGAYGEPLTYTAQSGDRALFGTTIFRRLLYDNNGLIKQTRVDFDTESVTVQAINGAVPEPATWAAMVIGFGLIGGAMRSRRRHRLSVTYA